jgi:hypothetical protein
LKAVATKKKYGIYRVVGFKAAATRKKNGTDRHSPETRRKMQQSAIRMWNNRRHATEKEEKKKLVINY